MKEPGILILIITLLLQTDCLSAAHYRNKLKLVDEWKEIEYLFPSKDLRRDALKDGRYIHNNSIPLDIDVYYAEDKKPKIYVSLPKFAPGVPITLGYVTTKQAKGGPKLQPYPDYSWHSSNGADCNGITSAIRIAIDKCNRLWVLDSGVIVDKQVCPPQLLAFDLKTDKLVHCYKIPASQYISGKSLFITPIVDVRNSPKGNCEKTFIYVADVAGFGLVVYDLSCGRSWRFGNKLMNPIPKYETITVSGQSFALKYGIVGMALSPNCTSENERLLYFHALASVTENTVTLSYLNNKKNWVSRPDKYTHAFKKIGSRGIQSIVEGMDRNGNLFFSITSPNAIVCWDSSTPYIKSNLKIVAQSKRNLQTGSAVKIIINSYGKEELWILSNRFQKFATGTLKTNETNFRIFTIPMEDILYGTKCRGKSLE